MDIVSIMLLLLGWAVSLVVLYFVIRFAVLHAIRDSRRPAPTTVAQPPAGRAWFDQD
ncbi:hypothetical protein [uncultured Microbacterium sp.]|uniref:hypothetical protein n=1 Tax=uncultured Microbacterium sp. TaxID=191216 RepID=UPI001AC5D382|nr:hypothetical protein [uncultured Microbacterium sp.]MBN9141096.1 hypothetical protein [Micrococcales bacterium]